MMHPQQVQQGPQSGSLPPPVGAVPVPAPIPPSASTTQAAAPPESTQVSSLPLPPLQYVKSYTDENVMRGLAPQPPPPILHEGYQMFGAPFPSISSPAGAPGTENDIVQSLESQGFRRLYSAKDVDRKKELKKLNHSLLVNFLDLLDILIRCPDTPRRDEKIEDINVLFINMHHLINEFRPHQARETLRVMLHVQKRKRLQVAEKFQGHLDKIQTSIREALEALPDLCEDSKEGILPPSNLGETGEIPCEDNDSNDKRKADSVTEKNILSVKWWTE
ncbi:MED7 [Lepeophtheirus salmonis]|uniref:Mediator of RNA polymerase II transcription subunit 7 n=1 Tax=Lepeophtheirus salmonis TaxID=72036 RepID=A0A7R8HCN1_LEPSM|nr:MED7 [Lepeophtheirus salmonis]CAF3013215.1 MED7 [Lepeophtheirus salmonis]